MGKTEEEAKQGSSFLDLFELDFNKYKTEETEEIVQSGESGVEEIPQEVEESTEENVEETVAEEKTEEEPVKEEKIESTSEVSSDLESILNQLVNEDILSFDGEKEYEASAEGIKELLKETVEKKSKEVLDTYKKSLPEEANKLLDILEKGGTFDDYVNMSQQIDFSSIPLEDKEGKPLLQNQLHLIEDWLQVQKYTKEEIKEVLEDYQESGIVKKQAEIAKKKLTSWQNEKNAELIKQREEAKLLQEKEEKEAANAFREEVLNVKEIAGFKVTKDKAEKLYNFITKRDKDGKTGFQKADTDENRLLYAYMAMEGFDKDKLVKDVATKQALKLKKTLSNFKDTQAVPKRGADDIRRQETSDVIKNMPWIF